MSNGILIDSEKRTKSGNQNEICFNELITQSDQILRANSEDVVRLKGLSFTRMHKYHFLRDTVNKISHNARKGN